MNLLKNWLAQTLVICLTTYGVLCCAPAATPCKIRILVPEAKITGLGDAGVECTDNTAVANSGFNTGKPGVTDKNCEIPNGHMIEVADKACDTDDVPGEPILVDGARILPPNHIDLKCNQGVLPAIKDDDTIDNDVHQIACHSAITERNCDFTLMDIDEARIKGDKPGGTNPNRYIREGQKFTIDADACFKNGYNRPLSINGFTNPPVVSLAGAVNENEMTEYVCSRGKLRGTGGTQFITAPDVNMIQCANLCVLEFDDLNPANNPTTNFGTCTPISNGQTCIVTPGISTGDFVPTDLCMAGEQVELTGSDGGADLVPATPFVAGTDDINFSCQPDGTVTTTYVVPGAMPPDTVYTVRNTFTVSCNP